MRVCTCMHWPTNRGLLSPLWYYTGAKYSQGDCQYLDRSTANLFNRLSVTWLGSWWPHKAKNISPPHLSQLSVTCDNMSELLVSRGITPARTPYKVINANTLLFMNTVRYQACNHCQSTWSRMITHETVPESLVHKQACCTQEFQMSYRCCYNTAMTMMTDCSLAEQAEFHI